MVHVALFSCFVLGAGWCLSLGRQQAFAEVVRLSTFLGLVLAAGLALRAVLRVRVCFTSTETWVESGLGRRFGQRHLEGDVRVFAISTCDDDESADYGYVTNNRLVVGRTADTAEHLVVTGTYGLTAEDLQAFAAVANEAVGIVRATQ